MQNHLGHLARANDENKSITDRFQLVVNGAEIINAYSELVDPIEQRKRLETQAKLKGNGDLEAMEMDEDYLTAMEYGMPPILGWGFGIERLLMVLTNCETIKDCTIFPLTKKL
ncbi:amino acid--tRNA ligase-related protein [Guptibacillus hwajinpoensis]|uniref:amino acid--tRNA ligase-related protein n=1 Tax=Guptibacillus hwajinpoensis TaxID=208199 RepID=UPI001F412668|nr:amino acid--tRNA ligase-related protein [Pseudalkalibacillus hwajinpoensis]